MCLSLGCKTRHSSHTITVINYFARVHNVKTPSQNGAVSLLQYHHPYFAMSSNKRARVQPVASTSAAVPRPLGLFAPFRSLGHISTAVPFVVQSKSSKFLETPALTVLTSLGHNWALWDGSSLKLLFVGSLSSPLLLPAFFFFFRRTVSWLPRPSRSSRAFGRQRG